ncbi:MAG: DUF402 domain-containing protein [Oscillospiraceae bacterium]|nr:DUF402 domain-containing protein [Oscillospiraceae bacterium]
MIERQVKDMRRSDWSRILRREYVSRDCQICGIRGKESLLVIREVTRPLTVHDGGEDVLIAEKDYAWVQIALEGLPFWMTAMYDDRGRLIQIYFDITAGNRFNDPENPTFVDMYLDIVVNSRGELYILDREELDAALSEGAVTAEEWNQADAACTYLSAYLAGNREAVTALCGQVYRELWEQLGPGEK